MTEIISPISFNKIHKRFMVIYESNDMRKIWKKVRSEWKKEKKNELPKRFKKYPEMWIELNHWIELKILKYIELGGRDVLYYNKSDLKERDWDDKIIKRVYPNPDKIVYLGRGRYAYYYDSLIVDEVENSEEFIEYMYDKLEKRRKRLASKEHKKYASGYTLV